MPARGNKYFKATVLCSLVRHANTNLKQPWERWSAAEFENFDAFARFALPQRTLRAARAARCCRRISSSRTDRPHGHLAYVHAGSRLGPEPMTGAHFRPTVDLSAQGDHPSTAPGRAASDLFHPDSFLRS